MQSKSPQSTASVVEELLPQMIAQSQGHIEVESENFLEEHPLDDEDNAGLEESGAFELNFAEFPIAHLTRRLPKGVNKHKIQYSDYINGPQGEYVERKWTIVSAAEHGLGGPTSVRVLFELLQIWKEQNFEKNRIYIGSYYNLIRRLGWPLNGNSYSQVKKDLESLYGLEVVAENAFYDKEQNKYVNYKFKPFIGWGMWKQGQIEDDDISDYGFIEIHPSFHNTFKKKSLYYIPIDSATFRKYTAHEQKLALYLTKVFNPYRKRVMTEYKRNILSLCKILPIMGDIYFQKRYLIKATEGLIKKKFILLENYKLENENIIFYNRQQQSMLPFLNTGSSNHKNKVWVKVILEDIMKVCQDPGSEQFYTMVAKKVPDEIIYECLSTAKQDGKDPKKLFTFLIQQKGAKYFV